MPVGRWGSEWVRANYAADRGWGKAATAGAAIVCGILYVATALWYDLAVLALARFASNRFGRTARTVISVGCAVVIFATITAVNISVAHVPAHTPGPIAVAATSPTPEMPRLASPAASATPSPTVIAPTATPTATSTQAPTPVDGDDEAGPSSAPGAPFTPGPTGAPFVAGSSSAADRLPGEPDPVLTPGALNPAVTQATIGSTVCVSGWTATIRPPSGYTTGLKVKQIAEYGYSDTSTAAYEEDHLISLELGGSPTDPRNLWPEPYTASLADGRSTGAHTKDGFETKLKNEVCSGTISLAQAQSEIGDHWVHAFYGMPFASGTPTAAPSATPKATAAPATAAPTTEPVATDPYADAKAAGATAVCADGTWSYSPTRSGTCSGHGGVHWWTGNVGAAGPGAH